MGGGRRVSFAVVALVVAAASAAKKAVVRPTALGGDGRLKDRVRRRAKGWLREAKAALLAAEHRATKLEEAAALRAVSELRAVSCAHATPRFSPPLSSLLSFWLRWF